jgi:hypothetical protein
MALSGPAITLPPRGELRTADTATVLQILLSCATAALDPAPARAFVAPGQMVAFDDCCDGQVWTRLVALEPQQASKLGATVGQGPCGQLWAVTVGVGVLRCAAGMTDQGTPPTAAAMTADAVQMAADLNALADAIYCCLAEQLPAVSRQFRLSRWDPIGPDGGCVGGEWITQMVLQNIGCP